MDLSSTNLLACSNVFFQLRIFVNKWVLSIRTHKGLSHLSNEGVLDLHNLRGTLDGALMMSLQLQLFSFVAFTSTEGWFDSPVALDCDRLRRTTEQLSRRRDPTRNPSLRYSLTGKPHKNLQGP